MKLALALLLERGAECPGAMSVLVCHAEVVLECDAQRAADAEVWLDRATIEGMDAVMNDAHEVIVPVEVEVRIARSWGDEG